MRSKVPDVTFEVGASRYGASLVGETVYLYEQRISRGGKQIRWRQTGLCKYNTLVGCYAVPYMRDGVLDALDSALARISDRSAGHEA